MPTSPDDLANELITLAQAPFSALSRTERSLLAAAALGRTAMGSLSENPQDTANDPSTAENWGAERIIRADLLRWLCTQSQIKERVASSGIRLVGARIIGAIDLSFETITFPILFTNCYFSEEITLNYIEISAIYLVGCRTQKITAEGARVKGSVFLSDGFSAQGQVLLQGSNIGGSVNCSRGRFIDTERPAINAEGAHIQGSVFLNNGFGAQGQVHFQGCTIGGSLNCEGAALTNPTGVALNAEGADIKGYVFLRNGFRAEGEVKLIHARIRNSFECDGGTFINPKAKAISLEGARIGGSIFLRNGCRTVGEVNLMRTEIGNDLSCERGTFTNPGAISINADGIVVHGYIFFRKEFQAYGEVKLIHAYVGRSVECDGGTFTNPQGRALTADGAEVKGYVFLRNGFRSEGEVNLLHIRIEDSLECNRSSFINQNGCAIELSSAHVKGDVQLSDGFVAEGKVLIAGATIAGDLMCDSGSFSEIFVQTSVIGGNLFWRNIRNPSKVTLDLKNSTARAVIDDSDSWPTSGKLKLNGFVYGNIYSGPTDAQSRIDWLRLDIPFAPQPYRQLASVLALKGDNSGVRRTLFEMEDSILKKKRGVAPTIWRWTLRLVVGYGYRSYLAVIWLLALSFIGAIVYLTADRAGAMAPTDKEAYTYFHAHGTPPDGYQRFNPYFFSLENSLPLVKLGQADRWQPDPTQRLSPSSRNISPSLTEGIVTSPRFLFFFLRLQVLSGWILATLFAAGVIGIVHHD